MCASGFGLEAGSTLPPGLSISKEHKKARLNGPNAWCYSDADPRWSVDFGRIVTITGFATQGHPSAKKWMLHYYIGSNNETVHQSGGVKVRY